nr:nitrous oxide reductase maturation protein [uncultured bacterium]
MLFVLAACFMFAGAGAAAAEPILAKYLGTVAPGDIAPGADAFGPIRDDLPVAEILAGDVVIGHAFVTSDFVGTTGYSGKPIDVLLAISPDAVLLGAQLMHHSEPIVLIGIPEAKITNLIANYAGLDIAAEAAADSEGHDLDIISGATVTIMVIDDSVVRSGIKVARALGLGGMAPEAASTGPTFEIAPDDGAILDWRKLTGEGSVRRLDLDIGQINDAFAATGDERAAARPEAGDPSDTFIDMGVALVSVPAIGRSLLGEAEYANLLNWLEPGEHAILVVGRGHYSFKGSGYVRGGIFDRIQLIQGDASVRFRDRMHRRLGAVAAAGAPSFVEVDIFRIPADSGFDPTEPWRLQLLVQRQVGAVEKVFLTFDLEYRLPETYLRRIAAPGAAPAPPDATEDEAQRELWQRIWRDRAVEIGGLVAMLAVLTGVFFFQKWATVSDRFLFWFRISFLTVTLFFLGWYANAQLSVVNLMALANTVATGFTWNAFLLDPLVFILWFSVAAALLFWGRGPFCGWLCPFGALQELTNRLAKAFRIPQWHLPWGLHERLWPVKYMIFLGLLGTSFASLALAEQLAEVEPFKTAIVLKFARSWPYVLFVTTLLGIGLFVERFYCRYLCPLGAALAIPGRLRMFDWLKRYRECGNPCQTCAKECMVQAIHPSGEINPNECLYCLHCQMLYQSEAKCPVVIKQVKRMRDFDKRNQGTTGAMDKILARGPSSHQEEGKTHG